MAGKITRARPARPYRRLQSGYRLAGLRRDGSLTSFAQQSRASAGEPTRSGIRPELRLPHAAAQTRIVSVARIRPDSRKSVRPFKGIICVDISEFESYMPSHAVGSPPLDSALSARGKDKIGSSFRRPSLLK
jgi:hypothetical protein